MGNVFFSKLRKALTHPSLVVAYATGGERKKAILHARLELERARRLYAANEAVNLEDLVRLMKERLCFHTAYLYGLCRRFKPSTVIETGVFYGASSSFILQALQENDHGTLYSIDLPNIRYLRDNGLPHSDTLPNKAQVGFAVPFELRERWNLKLGNAKLLLPELLSEINRPVDLFHHDSRHTYEHMMFEFNTVWPHLSHGGLIVSDDVDWNDAFNDFCATKNARNLVVGKSTGMCFRI